MPGQEGRPPVQLGFAVLRLCRASASCSSEQPLCSSHGVWCRGRASPGDQVFVKPSSITSTLFSGKILCSQEKTLFSRKSTLFSRKKLCSHEKALCCQEESPVLRWDQVWPASHWRCPLGCWSPPKCCKIANWSVALKKIFYHFQKVWIFCCQEGQVLSFLFSKRVFDLNLNGRFIFFAIFSSLHRELIVVWSSVMELYLGD